MEKYTIYCNSIQTRKALELGAPLFRLYGANCSDYIDMLIINDTEVYTIPTAEQMISWLEERGLFIIIDKSDGGHIFYKILKENIYVCEWNSFSTRKEATLAAIDSALDYLINNKK